MPEAIHIEHDEFCEWEKVQCANEHHFCFCIYRWLLNAKEDTVGYSMAHAFNLENYILILNLKRDFGEIRNVLEMMETAAKLSDINPTQWN